MVLPYEKQNKTNTQKNNEKPNMHWSIFFILHVMWLDTPFQQNVNTCYELHKLMHTINTLNYSRYHNTMHTTMANQRILPQSV